MSETPIYDQTVKAQDYNPLPIKITHINGAPISKELSDALTGVSFEPKPGIYELSPEIAAQINAGLVGGMSIARGGILRNGRR